MVTKLITASTPAEIEAWTRKVRAPKEKPTRKLDSCGRSIPLVAARDRVIPASAWGVGDKLFVTIPVYCESNTSEPIGQAARWAKKQRNDDKKNARDTTWETLCCLMPAISGADASVRESIVGLHLDRISKGRLFAHDNLPHSLKAILDAICAWIEDGVKVLSWTAAQRQRIGYCDDRLIATTERPTNRITLTYGQQTWASNHWLMGVEVSFRLKP